MLHGVNGEGKAGNPLLFRTGKEQVCYVADTGFDFVACKTNVFPPRSTGSKKALTQRSTEKGNARRRTSSRIMAAIGTPRVRALLLR